MTISRRWVLTSVFSALGALTAACGATTKNEQAGPDVGGSTHWLAKCKEDSECGSTYCYVGVCTRPCVRTSECGTNENAQCVSGVALTTDPVGESCRTDASVCLVPCNSSASCGSGQTCSDGFCVGSRASCDSVGSVYNRDAGASVTGTSSGFVPPGFDDASVPPAVSSNVMGDPNNFPGPVSSDGPSSSMVFTEFPPSFPPAQVSSSTAPVPVVGTGVASAASSSFYSASLSPGALSGEDDAPVYSGGVSVYVPPGYCDSNTVEGLSSSLIILDADSNSYKLSLQAGEQDCEAGQCSAEGRPPDFASLVNPMWYPFFGVALDPAATPCSNVDGGGAVCLPRHKLPWGDYTVQFCAYQGELEFPDATREILCKRTSDEPVCITGNFTYPNSQVTTYLELPEVE